MADFTNGCVYNLPALILWLELTIREQVPVLNHHSRSNRTPLPPLSDFPRYVQTHPTAQYQRPLDYGMSFDHPIQSVEADDGSLRQFHTRMTGLAVTSDTEQAETRRRIDDGAGGPRDPNYSYVYVPTVPQAAVHRQMPRERTRSAPMDSGTPPTPMRFLQPAMGMDKFSSPRSQDANRMLPSLGANTFRYNEAQQQPPTLVPVPYDPNQPLLDFGERRLPLQPSVQVQAKSRRDRELDSYTLPIPQHGTLTYPLSGRSSVQHATPPVHGAPASIQQVRGDVFQAVRRVPEGYQVAPPPPPINGGVAPTQFYYPQ